MLFHLFNTLRERIPGANVFRYVSTRVGLATLTSLLITFFVAPWFIRRAREGYYRGLRTFNDKAARREWKRKFRREICRYRNRS